MAPNYKSDQTRRGEVLGWCVYVVEEQGGAFSKIGTAATPPFRLESLQSGNPRRLKPINTWRLRSRDEAFTLEKEVLARCGVLRVGRRDWVSCCGVDLAAVVDATIVALGLGLYPEKEAA